MRNGLCNVNLYWKGVNVPYTADALLITSDICDVLPPPLPADGQSHFNSLESSIES